MDQWGPLLFYGSLVALAILLLRFILNDLYKTYRSLFLYFAAVFTGGSIVSRVPYATDVYMQAYILVELSYHILALFVVLEMYRIALAGHVGLAKFGRAGFLIATGLALTVAAAICLFDRNLPPGQSANIHWVLMLQRSWDLVIIVFLVLICLFITWFPVEMSKNTALGIAGFTVIVFVRAGMLLVANLLPRRDLAMVNNARMLLEMLMTLAWAAVIRPEKAKDHVQGHFWDPAAMGRLNQQLDSINAALVRFVRY